MAHKMETAAAGTATGSETDHAASLIGPENTSPTNANQAPSWRDVLPVHPAAELFPLMAKTDPAALKELGEDIKKNGQQEPIVFWREADEYQLLDGRNRLDAMELVGITIVADPAASTLGEKFGDDIQARFIARPMDPWAYVVSVNLHRRHLTADDKRRIIAELIKANPEKSDRTIARQAKDDHKKVGRVRAALEATGAVPQLEKTIGKDDKARRRPTERQTKPKPAETNRGVPQARPTAAKRTSGLPTGAQTAPRDAIGPSSSGELQRLQQRIEELQAELRQRDIKIAGLEDLVRVLALEPDESIEEFRADYLVAVAKLDPHARQGELQALSAKLAELVPPVAPAPPPEPDDGLGIPDFLRADLRRPAP